MTVLTSTLIGLAGTSPLVPMMALKGSRTPKLVLLAKEFGAQGKTDEALIAHLKILVYGHLSRPDIATAVKGELTDKGYADLMEFTSCPNPLEEPKFLEPLHELLLIVERIGDVKASRPDRRLRGVVEGHGEAGTAAAAAVPAEERLLEDIIVLKEEDLDVTVLIPRISEGLRLLDKGGTLYILAPAMDESVFRILGNALGVALQEREDQLRGYTIYLEAENQDLYFRFGKFDLLVEIRSRLRFLSFLRYLLPWNW